MGRTREILRPDLFQFDWLFHPLESKDASLGFPRGSTVLIQGTPGAGKSIMALAILRNLMRQREAKPDENAKESGLYLISPELDKVRLTRRYASLGWFNDERDQLFKERCKIIHPSEVDLPHPTHGAEELINHTLSMLRKEESPASRPEYVFVMVDSLTALLKDSPDSGSRRRNMQEFVARLRDAIVPDDRLGLMFLIAERGDVEARDITPEENLASVVFHLRTRSRSAGRRLFCFEIQKSHGAPMLIGEHTWAIITQERIDDVIAQAEVQEHIRNKMQENNESATIAVFPRPKLPRIGTLQDWDGIKPSFGGTSEGDKAGDAPRPLTAPAEVERLWSGIPGLEEMIDCDTVYFGRPQQQVSFARQQGCSNKGVHLTGSAELGRSRKANEGPRRTAPAEDRIIAVSPNDQQPVS